MPSRSRPTPPRTGPRRSVGPTGFNSPMGASSTLRANRMLRRTANSVSLGISPRRWTMKRALAGCSSPAVVVGACWGAQGVGGSAAVGGGLTDAAIKQASGMPTPRTATGLPDLTGFWIDGSLDIGTILAPNATTVSGDGKVTQLGFAPERLLCERGVASFKKRTADPSLRPSYKPEYQAHVDENFRRQQYLDPSFRCQPEGVPREGPPKEIVQTPTTLYFFYRPVENNRSFRVVPIDGRPHRKDADAMADGDSVGRWEGDTLVVDVTN